MASTTDTLRDRWSDLIGADLIDSRDLCDLLAEAEAEADALAEDDDASAEDRDDLRDLIGEIRAAVAMVDDYAEDDASDGVALIRDTYFAEYARDLAEDIGAIDPQAGWPHSCIDWERAADELRMDYTAVEILGVRYWLR